MDPDTKINLSFRLATNGVALGDNIIGMKKKSIMNMPQIIQMVSIIL